MRRGMAICRERLFARPGAAHCTGLADLAGLAGPKGSPVTSARSARRRAVLAARAGATVRGPVLASLLCGCVVDDAGGVWRPCDEIRGAHAWAMELARQGPQLRAGDHPRNEHGYPDPRVPTEMDRVLATIAAHVEAGERAAHGMAEQAVML